MYYSRLSTTCYKNILLTFLQQQNLLLFITCTSTHTKLRDKLITLVSVY